jgi:hypothetical protein
MRCWTCRGQTQSCDDRSCQPSQAPIATNMTVNTMRARAACLRLTAAVRTCHCRQRSEEGPRRARLWRGSCHALRQPHVIGGDGGQTAGVPLLTAPRTLPVRACRDCDVRHRRVRGVTQRARREPDALRWESRSAWDERRRMALWAARRSVLICHSPSKTL